MIEFKLDLLKDFQRPIIKVDDLDAIIDTGAMIPTFSIAPSLVEKAFNAKLVLQDGTIFGFGGECRGRVYEVDEFFVGRLSYKPFQFFVPDEAVSRHPLLLSASMFYGTIYEFDTIEKKFTVRVSKEEDLVKSFYLRNLSGKLYAQIGDVLFQDSEFCLEDEIDNYTQISHTL